MNNSQSSDVFSGSGNYIFDDSSVGIMDTVTYEDLVTNTKLLLSKNVKIEVNKSTFPEIFSSVLEDCGTCITQSLDLVIGLISDMERNLEQLCINLDNAVNILRMLCVFLAKVIEATSMNCCSMKTFPMATGRIIMTVFSHCKDSESIYGSNLKIVERQLKDLFRNCHELQLTYLMVMEKHFVFDPTEYEDLCILIEALDINLKIGEIVQTLDVKTMAEQWKAYTMICEKHADYLMDRHIYEDCTKVLCKMIENNVRTAVEMDQEDKIILRSLKVASFTIKILLRVCNIFKHAVNKNYEHIAQLLFFVYLNNPAYLELVAQKSAQFLNLIDNNVTISTGALLKELLMDENFDKCLFKDKIEKEVNDDDKHLSYILLIISAIKLILQENKGKQIKRRILDYIFQWLPCGHVWFNVGLKFRSANSITFGLYEYLLTNTFAIASTFDSEEMNYLEQKMYESLLGTDCYAAMFSSNLWELLARSNAKQCLLIQVISLCKVYQALQNNGMFAHSPQQIYLTETIKTLFKCLNSKDKTKIHKQFRISDTNNYGLWSALEIKTCDCDLQMQSEEQIFKNLEMEFDKALSFRICPEEIESLVKVIKLSATCTLPPVPYAPLTFREQDLSVEDYIIKAWMKLCPNNNKFLLSRGALDKGSLWYLEFVAALVSLTMSMLPNLRKSANFVKILHVVSSLIDKGNTELKLVLINLLLKLPRHQLHDENSNLLETLLMKTFIFLLQESDSNVQNKFWNDLRNSREDTNIARILSKIFNKQDSLQEKWDNFAKNDIPEFKPLKINLVATMEFEFTHKCIENQNMIELSDPVSDSEKRSNSNFDFADIDTLFEVESDSEPACKRAKPDTNEAEEIITRLEKDASLLSNVKENITSDCKVRIRVLCEKLINIID